MKYLVFDTETTGLPLTKGIKGVNPNPDNWPYIVQLSFMVYDDHLKKITTMSDQIVRVPNGVVIPNVCAKIHGITTEMSLTKGISIQSAIRFFMHAFMNVDVIVAHNAMFDLNMIKSAILRDG
jgi:DNA polymerase III epsilon subunit-like protein